MILGVGGGWHLMYKIFNNYKLMSLRVHVPLEISSCHIYQLLNLKNVSMKVSFNILNSDLISYAPNFPKNYFDKSHYHILNLRVLISTSKFE